MEPIKTSADVLFILIGAVMGLRLDQEDEYNGADIAIHNISATPEKQPVL